MSHPFEEPRPSAADQYGDPRDGGPHQYQPERPQGQSGGWTNDAQLEPVPIVTHALRPDAGPAVWDGPSVTARPEPAPAASPAEEAVAPPRRSLSGDWSAHQNAGAPAHDAPAHDAPAHDASADEALAHEAPVEVEPVPVSSPWARPDDAAAHPVEPQPAHEAAESPEQPEPSAPEQPSWAGAGTPTAAGYAEQESAAHTPPPGWGVDAPVTDAGDEPVQQAEPAQPAAPEQPWSNASTPAAEAQPWEQPPAAPQQDAQPWEQPPAAPQQDAQPWQQPAPVAAEQPWQQAASEPDDDRPAVAPEWGAASTPDPDDGPQPPSNIAAEEQATQLTPLTPEPDPESEANDESLTIGRGRDNAMVLDDMLVSRQHVRISVDDEGLVIEDLGSRNGTFVNGRRIERTHLNEGDRIGIGASTFEVRDGWLVAITS